MSSQTGIPVKRFKDESLQTKRAMFDHPRGSNPLSSDYEVEAIEMIYQDDKGTRTRSIVGI